MGSALKEKFPVNTRKAIATTPWINDVIPTWRRGALTTSWGSARD
jgi:hypothetical protein